MINNRQGGRRRGRGGQRPQNVGGRPDGNRQDNRQRGNAAQLLEKYKSMARDAQLGGDRVQAEYYLQFADHYFRVLGENRPRFEDQQRQRGDSDDEDGDEDMTDSGADSELGESGDDQRPDRQDRADRGPRNERRDRPQPRYQRDERGDAPEQGRANGRSRPEPASESIPLEALPPAIGRDTIASDDEAPKPKRRLRRPTVSDGDGEPAPVA